MLRAQAQSELLKPEQMNVAIIGAGATGTELAAELRSATRQLVAYGFDRIDPEKDITINLIEAADRTLPPLPKRLADEALKILKDLRVRVHTSARVEEVTATGVRLANGTLIPAELVVWAAGVKAPDILTKLDGLETNRASQLVVCRRCRPRATRTFLPSVTAPPALGLAERARPCLRVRKLRTSRPRIWRGN